MMRRNLPHCILVAAALFIAGCTGGGTIETTNGIVGSVYNSDGSPAPDAIVKVFPDGYNPKTDGLPQTGMTDTTDRHGNYRFSSMPTGTYTLLARSSDTANGFLESGIAVTEDSLTTVTDGTLLQQGTIAADFSSEAAINGGYVYIPGTDIFSVVGNDGSVVLTGVPPGTLATIMFASTNSGDRNILRTTIALAPGDTATISYPLWSYSRRIVLNTTAAGADIPGTVYGFPVLLRLNNDNFDFSHAEPDGRDLSFTDSNGKPLAFEIERWDVASSGAVLWVRIDTVFGNDSAQSITMYWGNTGAEQPSNALPVFDTAAGFQGVWHLSDAAPDSAADATVNNFDGTSPDSATPRITQGIIGNCRTFDGSNDYITMPGTAKSRLSFPQDGNYSISAWVRIDRFNGLPQVIVSKGYEQYFLRSTYFPSDFPSWEFTEFDDDTKWQSTRTPADSGAWVYLTGIREGATQRLYCNGSLVDSVKDVWYNAVSRDSSNDVSIGSFLKEVTVPTDDGRCFLAGSIDEVIISGCARSSDWIRLCYMNQRENDRLVRFR